MNLILKRKSQDGLEIFFVTVILHLILSAYLQNLPPNFLIPYSLFLFFYNPLHLSAAEIVIPINGDVAPANLVKILIVLLNVFLVRIYSLTVFCHSESLAGKIMP